MKKYYATVGIYVEAESAEEAAQEINDAMSYVIHAGGFTLTDRDRVSEDEVTEQL
jgi:uncharacterized protein YggE